MRSCCASMAGSGPACGPDAPPSTCELACAELWLPLSRDCRQYFAADQLLTSSCEDVASEFLGVAPSTVQIDGFDCHHDANGVYHIGSTTVGGKAHWVKASLPVYYLYAVDEPHSGYAVGSDFDTYVAWLETYESAPPWGVHAWHEVCRADSSVDQRRISLSPGFSNANCAEYLRLESGELTEACCSTGDSFDALLAAGTAPTECGWDCAHIWSDYSTDCSHFLDTFHPALATFTAVCIERHDRMTVYDIDSSLAEHGVDNHHFNAGQGLIYLITESPTPNGGLQRTEMELEAEGTSHPLAQQEDVTKQGDASHEMEWHAPTHIAALNVHVAALQGSGSYHLGVEIIGTVEMLSREAVVGRSVYVLTECRLYDDCNYRYGGAEMRTDGSGFDMKFLATTAFTYNFSAVLRRPAGSTTSAVHMQFAIFPPDSIASSDGGRARGGGECAELPQQFRELPHDTGNITLGRFVGPAEGRQSWGDFYCAEGHSGCCNEPWHVGPPEAPCDGSYTHYAGQHFEDSGDWFWTAPLTGEYILRVTANCDVPLYADPNQPSCTESEDGLDCEDDAIEQCTAGFDLTINTIDAAVHARHRFEVPILHVLGDQAAGGNDAALAGLATIFRTDRQSGLAFPTSITPFDCDIPEHAERESCRRKAAAAEAAGEGSGHRRARRLQVESGSANSCPFDTFLTREQETQRACGLRGGVDTDAAVFAAVLCPSGVCAETLSALFEDCATSIDHVSATQREYYTALEQSDLFASCLERQQRAAEFAEVEVEFRAPSLAAVNEMMAAHTRAVELLSQPGGCSTEQGAGSPCNCSQVTGRRTLQDDETTKQLTKQLAEAMSKIAELTEENHQLRAANVTAGTRSSSKRRRQQTAGESAIALTTVGETMQACAVAPCELPGACLHSGVCVPAPSVGENAFRCTCAVGYTGQRCEACADGFTSTRPTSRTVSMLTSARRRPVCTAEPASTARAGLRWRSEPTPVPAAAATTASTASTTRAMASTAVTTAPARAGAVIATRAGSGRAAGLGSAPTSHARQRPWWPLTGLGAAWLRGTRPATRAPITGPG